MIVLVGTFNKEKALVGAFSVIVKYSRTFVKPLFEAPVQAGTMVMTAMVLVAAY